MSSDEQEKPSSSPNRPISSFKSKQPEKQDSPSITSTGDPTAIEVKDAKPAVDDLKPVSLFGLFRSVFISLPFHLLLFLHRAAQVLHSQGGLGQCIYSYCRSSRWRLPGLFMFHLTYSLLRLMDFFRSLS